MGLSKSMGAALFADKIFLREAYFIGMPLGGSPSQKFASHWQHRAACLAAGPTLTCKHVKQQFEVVLVILRQIN